jgi:hypothetical protein
MQTPPRLIVVLLLVALAVLGTRCFAQNDSPLPKTYPDLNNTVWTGTDFQGKKYTFTFHSTESQRKIHFLRSADLSIPGGTFSVTTDPPQKMTGGTYFFVGPPGSEAHGEVTTYRVSFDWQGVPGASGCKFQGTLGPNGIYMDYVEPVVVRIDYGSLFGKVAKQTQNLGALVSCSGRDIGLYVDWHQDGKGARAALEEEITSGPGWGQGPTGLGEVGYSHGEAMLCFVRDNLFIAADRLTLPRTPEAEKEFEGILYKLDAAIRDEDPAVTILRMPKSLGRAL